jgi:hypothetical protein
MNLLLVPKRLAALILLACAMPVHAGTLVYTSVSTFLTDIVPGYSLETFDASEPGSPATLNYSGGGFAFTASSSGNMYAPGGFIGTSNPNTTLILTFTSGNPTAIGGDFYNTDFSDTFATSGVTVTLNDGTTRTYTPLSGANSFTGFTATLPILSLTVSAPGSSLYGGLDNLFVGQARPKAVPLPSGLALVFIGGFGLALNKSRRLRGDKLPH